VGITGPPGAGKSTLLKVILQHLGQVAPELSVGVLLVDPSSPFTGGALLGDRLRMDGEIGEKHFVRSLGSRGEVGGLCRACRDLVRLMLVSGKKWIFIETVGVGQVEHDVLDLADLTLVVLTPDSGDVIQTLKAGLMEIADLFVVNKADLSGSDRMVADLKALGDPQTLKPVVKTVATKNRGISLLWQEIEKQLSTQEVSGKISNPKPENLAREISQRLTHSVEKKILKVLLEDPKWRKRLDEVIQGRGDPYSLTQELLQTLFKHDS
jgi:LAO/AO transport system kinase